MQPASANPAPWQQTPWWLFVVSLSAAHLGVWLGNAGAVGLLGCWVVYAVLWPARAIRVATRSFWPWALPCFALASTLWSVQPALSLRAGCEFMLFTGVGLLMGSSLRPRAIASAFMVGMLVVGLGGLADGTTTLVLRAGSTAATGGLGSKNTFAEIGSLLLLSAGCCALDRGQPRLVRLAAVACLPLAAGILATTQSAGALESTAVAAALAFPLSLASRIGPRWRGVVVALAAIMALTRWRPRGYGAPPGSPAATASTSTTCITKPPSSSVWSVSPCWPPPSRSRDCW